MICLSFMLVSVSCEKSSDQTQITNLVPNEQLSPRAPLDECSDCPVDCCCCGIEALFGSTGTIELCGLCEGDYTCGTYSPEPPCSSTISGTGKNITFTLGHTREVICIAPGASFRIYNPHPTASITFRFACDYDETAPTFNTITLEAEEEAFFFNDGTCITEICVW